MAFTHQDSILVARSPLEVYALVSDVTRTGEWSPICRACEWDDAPGPDGPVAGAWFTGHNVHGEREWSTRSRVVAADAGRAFAWRVGDGGLVDWAYTMEPEGERTRLTESWCFRDEGLAFFADKYGEGAQAQIENRVAAAHEGIPVTLAAIKRVAEGGPA